MLCMTSYQNDKRQRLTDFYRAAISPARCEEARQRLERLQSYLTAQESRALAVGWCFALALGETIRLKNACRAIVDAMESKSGAVS